MSEPIPLRLDAQEVTTISGRSLLHAILDAGQPIATACGGEGRCHLCRVQITSGREALPPANAIEHKALGNVLIAGGWRLACQVRVEAPLAVSVPPVRPKRSAWPAQLSAVTPAAPAATPPASAFPPAPSSPTPGPRRRRRRGGRR